MLDPEELGTKWLETPGTLYPTIQCVIAEDFYLHQHSFGQNLKYRIPSSLAFFTNIRVVSLRIT